MRVMWEEENEFTFKAHLTLHALTCGGSKFRE